MELSHTPGVGRIHVLAHSMGAWLTMETLRGVASPAIPISTGSSARSMLATPDIDLNVFRQQVARVDPRHVSIFVARQRSRAVALVAHRRRRGRVSGRWIPAKPEDKAELDRLGVAVHDISSFSTDFVGHGAFAEAPDVVRKIGAQLTAPRARTRNAGRDRLRRQRRDACDRAAARQSEGRDVTAGAVAAR